MGSGDSNRTPTAIQDYSCFTNDDFEPFPFMRENHSPLSSLINQEQEEPSIKQHQQNPNNIHQDPNPHDHHVHDLDSTTYYNNNNHLALLKRSLEIVKMAKDRSKCCHLQLMIGEGNPYGVNMILLAVKDHLFELITHPSANFLVQTIFEAKLLTIFQKDSLVFLITSNDKAFLNFCTNTYGSRVIQTMLDNIESRLAMFEVVYAMRKITIELMIDDIGNHVLIQCLRLFPPEFQKVILDEAARNCIDIAQDKIGCMVMKKCLTHADRIAASSLVRSIVSNAVFLAEDPIGNYVLQFVVVELNLPLINEEIIVNLIGHFVNLSMSKYGSNVVEVLLQNSEQNFAAFIVEEIMLSNDFLNVLQDSYGNFVAQKALECTQGYLHRELYDKIKLYRRNLQSHPFGKIVLKKACEGYRFGV